MYRPNQITPYGKHPKKEPPGIGMSQHIISFFFIRMFFVSGGDQWTVEKYLFKFGPGNPVSLPKFGEVPLIPIEADTLRNQVWQFHELCIS
jgi:hypothetical protein